MTPRLSLFLSLPLFLLLSLSGPSAAQSVKRLLDTRQYDKAYEVAHRRAVRGRRATTRQIDNLLMAFDHLQLERMLRIRALESSPDPDRWLELHGLYTRAYGRSVDVLEIVGPTAIEHAATPKPAELEARREHARFEAGHYLQRRAEVLLPFAREGDKESARSSHTFFNRALRYRPEMTTEFQPFLEETKELGTVRVLLLAPSPTPLNEDFLVPLANRPPVRQEWFELFYGATDRRIDLFAEVELNDYAVDGPRETSSSRTHCAEVLDYIEKKTTRVKVNDSTYVDKVEEIKHYKTVTARSTTYTQQMNARLGGWLFTTPADRSGNVSEWPLSGTAGWSHEYTECSGDSDAFPLGCGGSPASPPDEFSLLSQAAKDVYPEAEHILGCNYGECPEPRRRRRLRVRR